MPAMKNAAPSQKVTAATVAAALVTTAFTLVPPEWEHLLQVKSEIIIIVTFIVGYYIPPAARDVIETQ